MEEHEWNLPSSHGVSEPQDQDLRPEPPDVPPILACCERWALPQEKVLVRVRPPFERPPQPRPGPPPSTAGEPA